ncbi:MAG: hypothetical protein ACRDPA_05270, partial [Solirubrobacteraceae bacterium]
MLEAPGPRRIVGWDTSQQIVRAEADAAVGPVCAQGRCEDAQLQGAQRVRLVNGMRGLDEDVLGERGRADVDLDMSSEPLDVAEQGGVAIDHTGA